MLTEHLWRLYDRVPFYFDVATIRALLRFQELRKEFYANLWRLAAEKVGATLAECGFGYYRLDRGGKTTFVKLASVMMDSHLTLDIMGNKALTYSLLREKGHPVPEFQLYTMRRFSVAADFLRRHRGPVVVKPASGTGGGRGVTTGITSPSALRRASRYAARFDSTLLIEGQAEGGSYRLLYLNGAFLDAVRRDAPTVTGDSRHTIRQLVAMHNTSRLSKRPIKALCPLVIDEDCRNRLEALGLSPNSTLDSARTIAVKGAVNENCAGENHGVKDRVHPRTVALGARMARDLGVRFAGVDVICKDISRPLSADNGRINEVNTTPGIHHHYLVAEPDRAVPVAELLLEHIFANRDAVMMLGAAPS